MESTELANVVFTGVVAAAALVLLVLYLSILQRNKFLLQQEKIKAIEYEKQKDVLSTMIQTQESERKRIAEDLHDSVATSMSLICFNLSTIVNKNEGTTPMISQSLKELDQLVDSIRGICYDLYPPYLHKYGIVAAIGQVVQNCRTTEMSATFNSDLSETHIMLMPDSKVNLFRIFQETFTNSIKHAKWTCCEVSMRLNGHNDINTIVKHNGLPFSAPVSSKGEAAGIGLLNTQRRLNLLNGKISYLSNGQQQTVDIQIPNAHG